MLTNEAGSAVAHRIYVGIDGINLIQNAEGVGMGYTTAFKADAQVQALLANNTNYKNKAYGFAIGLGNLGTPLGNTADKFSAENVTLHINGILDGDSEDATNYATEVWAQTFISLDLDGDGTAETVITSETYKISLKEVYDAMLAIKEIDETKLSAEAKQIMATIDGYVNA